METLIYVVSAAIAGWLGVPQPMWAKALFEKICEFVKSKLPVAK